MLFNHIFFLNEDGSGKMKNNLYKRCYEELKTNDGNAIDGTGLLIIEFRKHSLLSMRCVFFLFLG